MKKRILSVIIGLSLTAAMCSNAFALTTQTTDKKIIEVNANADQTVIPDIAYVSLGFTLAAKSKSEANKKSVAQTKIIIEDLKKNGVKDSQIKTTSIYINQNERYDNYPMATPVSVEAMGMPILEGAKQSAFKPEFEYTSSTELTVTISDVSKIQKIVDSAMIAGATNIGQIRYDIKDITAISSAATKKAIAKAKQKAGLIAQESGLKLGKIIAVSDSNSYYGNYDGGFYGGGMGYVGPAGIAKEEKMTYGVGEAIKVGEIKVNSSITVVFECE